MNEKLKSQFERRTSAHLDGELDAGQSAELYRQILREPEARTMVEEWSAADRTAAQALRRAVDAPSQAASMDQVHKRKRGGAPWIQIIVTVLLVLAVMGLWLLVPMLNGGE